jgi:hypothetical protein
MLAAQTEKRVGNKQYAFVSISNSTKIIASY